MLLLCITICIFILFLLKFIFFLLYLLNYIFNVGLFSKICSHFIHNGCWNSLE